MTNATLAAKGLFQDKDSRREKLIEHPETGDFLRGAMVEAAFQRENWSQADDDKTDADWFWLVGYLLGKALWKPGTDEHMLHHIEAAAAALANWHERIKSRASISERKESNG